MKSHFQCSERTPLPSDTLGLAQAPNLTVCCANTATSLGWLGTAVQHCVTLPAPRTVSYTPCSVALATAVKDTFNITWTGELLDVHAKWPPVGPR